MNSLTDQRLLREYTERRVEAAFGELVRRHVDLVYSAALRMVRDAHLAEDVTQGVFVALSRSAGQLRRRGCRRNHCPGYGPNAEKSRRISSSTSSAEETVWATSARSISR